MEYVIYVRENRCIGKAVERHQVLVASGTWEVVDEIAAVKAWQAKYPPAVAAHEVVSVLTHSKSLNLDRRLDDVMEDIRACGIWATRPNNVIGPRKPKPALPVEVFNEKKFDAVSAWEATKLASQGCAGAGRL